jgi:hypothetical protein
VKTSPFTRTTVDIPRPTYQQLKEKAARQGCSVKELVLRGVEQVLQQDRPQQKRRMKVPVIDSREPGTLDLTNEKIYEIIPFP